MVKYTVFLGFEIEAENPEAARIMAQGMVNRVYEFPEIVGCVGVPTPPCALEPTDYLIVLGHALEDESRRHAAQYN